MILRGCCVIVVLLLGLLTGCSREEKPPMPAAFDPEKFKQEQDELNLQRKRERDLTKK
jgi:hypothetical protein